MGDICKGYGTCLQRAYYQVRLYIFLRLGRGHAIWIIRPWFVHYLGPTWIRRPLLLLV